MVWPLLLALLLGPASATATVTTVEEVVAVVGAVPLLASDLELARMVELVAADAGESEAEHRVRLLEARIRLELQFRFLEETGLLFRLNVDPGPVAVGLERRLGDDAATRLERWGLSAADLRELALRLAATRAYVEERLRPRLEVSRVEVEAEHRRLQERARGKPGEALPPLEEVSDQVRQLLLERKLNAEVERWLEQARERFPVKRFTR